MGQRVGLLWMDLTELQLTLKRAVQKALATLCMVFEIASHSKLSSTLSALQAVVLKLRARPSSLPQYAEYLEAYKHMDSSRDELLSEGAAVKVCQHAFSLLGESRYAVCTCVTRVSWAGWLECDLAVLSTMQGSLIWRVCWMHQVLGARFRARCPLVC